MSGWAIAGLVAGGVVLGGAIAYVGLAVYLAKGMFR
jgi:hypothetical protein